MCKIWQNLCKSLHVYNVCESCKSNKFSSKLNGKMKKLLAKSSGKREILKKCMFILKIFGRLFAETYFEVGRCRSLQILKISKTCNAEKCANSRYRTRRYSRERASRSVEVISFIYSFASLRQPVVSLSISS